MQMTGWYTFPPEVWDKIVNKLENYYDANQLCYAIENIYSYAWQRLEKLRTKMVMQRIFGQENRLLSNADILNMRLVSTSFKEGVDAYYREKNFTSINEYNSPFICNDGQPKYPVAVLKWPLSVMECEQILKYSTEGGKSFFGQRLNLRLTAERDLNSTANVSRVIDASYVLWQNVKHLEISTEYGADITEGDPDFLDALYTIDRYGGFKSIFAQILPHLNNLKTFWCKCPMDLSCLLLIPNLEKVEVLSVGRLILEAADQWSQVLKRCHKNLQCLHVVYLSRGLENAMQDLSFPRLEEFETRNYKGRLDRYDEFYEEGYSDEEVEEEDFFQIIGRRTIFPNLKKFCFPFEAWKDTPQKIPMHALVYLILTSKMLKFLTHVEVQFTDYIHFQNAPNLGVEIKGEGGLSVTKVVVRGGPFKWAMLIAKTFSNIRTLYVDNYYHRDQWGILEAIGKHAENAVIDIGGYENEILWSMLPKLDTFELQMGLAGSLKVSRLDFEKSIELK